MTRLRASFAFTAVVLRGLFRDRTALFFFVALPVVVIVIIGSAFGGPSTLRIGLVRNEASVIGDALSDALARADGIELRRYDDLEHARRATRRFEVVATVVLPADLADTASAGGTVALGFLALPTNQDAVSARVAVAGAVDATANQVAAARFAATATAVPAATAQRAAADAADGATTRFAVVTTDVGSGRAAPFSRFSLTAPQNLVLFVFINSMTSAGVLVNARRTGILRRSQASPAGTGTVLAGLGLGWLSLALVQSAVILLVGAVGFGVRWGAPIAAALLVVVFAVVGCGTGLLVGALGRDADKVSAITPPLGIVLGALGGCMIPLEVFPAGMRRVAHVVPHTWAIEAWQALVFDGGGLADIAGSLAVLALFGAALVSSAIALLRHQLARGVGSV